MTIWVAYYSDWSGIAIFATEIEAYRHAVQHTMSVKAVVLPCPDLREATK